VPGSRLQSVRQQRLILLLSVGIQAALGLLCARIYLARHNTLQANAAWRTTKTELARGLNGAFAYFTGQQTLAGGELNLGAWQGYNEVILRRELDLPRQIEFDFRLGEGANLVVLFDRDEQGGGAGVRLSTDKRDPNAFLVVDPDGAFLARTTFPIRRLAKTRPHRADIALEPESVVVRIDGNVFGTFAHRSRPQQYFGFRGSRSHAFVDNIAITLASGERITEDFSGPAGAAWLGAATVLSVVVLNLGLFLTLRRLLGGDDRTLAFHFLMVNLTLLAMGGLLYGFVLIRSGWYPELDAVLQASEVYYGKGARSRVLEDIRQRYGDGPAPDRRRVLFVGSSQTWGAGALRDDQTFVAVLESLLDQRRPGRPSVECINGGISSARAEDLEPLLVDRWLRLRPDVVVINLASNDRSSGEAFAAAIRRMVAAVTAAGACPILVKEANAVGTIERGLVARYGDLDAIAAEASIPVIDMHAHLGQFEDQGFLWWDKVHLTPYGQRLVAEKLAEELAGVLD
jgi:lysophospholipase L1-like esterase